MRISYQKLFIIFMCIPQLVSATTLHNKSNTCMRFNIFTIDKEKLNFNFFPKKIGKTSAQSSCNIENLNPQKNYVINLYDVYNFKNNKTYIVSGSTHDVIFEIQ